MSFKSKTSCLQCMNHLEQIRTTPVCSKTLAGICEQCMITLKSEQKRRIYCESCQRSHNLSKYYPDNQNQKTIQGSTKELTSKSSIKWFKYVDMNIFISIVTLILAVFMLFYAK